MNLIRAWQMLWLAGLAFLMAIGLAGVILIYDRPELVAVPQFADLTADLGLPLWVLTTTAHLIPMLVSTALAVAVFRGKRHDPVALGFGWGLVGTFVYAAGAPRAVAAVFPRLATAATLAEVAAILPLLVLVYVFPDGRFRPRWTRWPALAVVVALVAVPQGPGEARLYMIDPRQPRWAAATFAVLLAVWILTAVPAQMIRYRRYADMVQRQQVRWILVGFASLLVPTPVVGLLVVLRAPTWLVGGALLLLAVVSLVLPITTGIALFRYRLFELDRIVTRTFTYAVVTGVLLAVYAGLVFLLRQLLPVEGDLAVAASTLAVAALFNPLRQRVQGVVDRRFNRSRYDAAEVAGRFARRLRDGVDLDQLAGDLRAVVAATVQPAHVSLWLRDEADRQPTSPPRQPAAGDGRSW